MVVGSRTFLGIDFGVHLGCPGEVWGSTWGAQGRPWAPFGRIWGLILVTLGVILMGSEGIGTLQGAKVVEIGKKLEK